MASTTFKYIMKGCGGMLTMDHKIHHICAYKLKSVVAVYFLIRNKGSSEIPAKCNILSPRCFHAHIDAGTDVPGINKRVRRCIGEEGLRVNERVLDLFRQEAPGEGWEPEDVDQSNACIPVPQV